MLHSEVKQTCDLISLVANAIATNTIPEAIQYLTERYDENDEIVYHCYCILNKILEKKNKF